MALVESILNVVVPASAALTVIVMGPFLAFFKAVMVVVTWIFPEDVQGKVVLITGASSGIGEHIAYEYARRGARLALGARRENQLNNVADRAMAKGAMDVKVIVGDVTKEEDCKRFVDETIRKYGRLDHLVNNAGVAHSFFFADTKDLQALTSTFVIVGLIMWANQQDTTFWGQVYTTYHAVPHLRRTRGKILVIDSVASWLPYPRQSLYNAGKSAEFAFFDTLRVEVGDRIDITIVMPGWIESEMSRGKFIHEDADTWTDQGRRDLHIGPVPVTPVTECAQAAVNGVLRSYHYVIVPFYYSVFFLYRVFAPEVLLWVFRLFYVIDPKKPLSKRVVEITGVNKILYPESIQKSE